MNFTVFNGKEVDYLRMKRQRGVVKLRNYSGHTDTGRWAKKRLNNSRVLFSVMPVATSPQGRLSHVTAELNEMKQ